MRVEGVLRILEEVVVEVEDRRWRVGRIQVQV